MKTSELMRGDWVCVYSNDRTETHPFRVNEIVDCGVYDSHKGFVEEKDIEPIPLTSEILEKNGFEKGQFEWSGYALTDNLFICSVGMFENHSFEIIASDMRADIPTGIYLDGVHDLQHALKSLKIDKEIIL